jgi:hypothetical protein
MSEAGHRTASRHERARTAIVSVGLAPVVAYLSAYLVLGNVLWFYHDRYWLPVLFAIVVLALGRNVTVVRAPALAWGVATLFAAIALVGTRDTFRFNQAVRDGSQVLVDRGVPRSDLDAGYSWNGWMLYAHPENLAQGPGGRPDVPWVTTMRMTPYVLATSPMPDYVIERKITWDDRWWPRPDHLFVLRRQGSGTSPSTGGPTD